MSKRKKSFVYASGKKYDGTMGRCYRLTDTSYKSYGSRGIKVCSAWIKDIRCFRQWLVEELFKMNVSITYFVENSKYFQLDRIDSDGHYSPLNCRLATPQINTRNRKVCNINNNSIISAEGETIKL